MTILPSLADLGERFSWPDPITRPRLAGSSGKPGRGLLPVGNDADLRFAAEMATYPIAIDVVAANAQRYEIPEDFFALVLGWDRSANIHAAFTKPALIRLSKPRNARLPSRPSMQASPTASAFSNSAAAGLCRCGWRGTTGRPGSLRYRTRIRNVTS